MGLMVNMEIRAATKADIIAYRGEVYSESFKGIVVDMDGEIIGIGGVINTSPLQAFSNITDKLRKSPKTSVKAARLFRKLLNSYQYDIYAYASEEEVNAPGYLEYIGFDHVDNRIYKWPTKDAQTGGYSLG